MISLSLHHCSSCSKQFILMWCYVYTMCYYPQLIALTGFSSYTIARLTFLTESCVKYVVFFLFPTMFCMCDKRCFFRSRCNLCNLSFQVPVLVLLIRSLIWWSKISFYGISWIEPPPPFHLLVLCPLHFLSIISSPCSLCPPFLLFSVNIPLSFGPQALLIRALLEYSQSSVSSVPYGLGLVAGIFLMELMRSWTLGLTWAVSYRTATRLRGAALTFAFNKILRLRSTKDTGLGEVCA